MSEHQSDSDPMVLETFRVPKSWRVALKAIAHERRIARADLYRQMVRDLMKRAHE